MTTTRQSDGKVKQKTRRDSQSKTQKYVFIISLDTKTGREQSIKLLPHSPDCEVTTVKYGPYDNGYLLLGFSDGVFMALDTNNEIQVILNLQLFESSISNISFEPTNLVFVSSGSDIVALNLVKKKMSYVYLDLGYKRFCTVAVPKHEPTLQKQEPLLKDLEGLRTVERDLTPTRTPTRRDQPPTVSSATKVQIADDSPKFNLEREKEEGTLIYMQ
jgi:hypothetical protein